MTSEKPEIVGNYQVVDGELKTRREVLLMGAMAAGGAVMAATGAQAQTGSQAAAGAAIAQSANRVQPKDFSGLVAKNMPGFSAKQLQEHFKLYNGYVTKINEIQAALTTVDPNTPPPNTTYHPYRELLVEESYALNGVVYHELYFGNLGGAGGEPTGDLRAALEARWGNMGRFMDYFNAAGKSMRGWVIIGWNTRDGNIHPYGLDLHNMWVPANVVPLVVLDTYEHAYFIDYGTNRGGYLESFLKNMDWEVAARRFQMARRHPSGAESTV